MTVENRVAILLCMVVLHFLVIQAQHGATPGSLQPQECSGRCAGRCSATAYKKPCMFFCQKCCAKCLCVPPGTYGNKQFCPCYNNWKTKRGGPKCP
ncbi:Gibberellin regulated protein [Musa troglodytarum]|uniref:Gibberellin regulated protein n=1 Tax=Musa troglodytarum TaxID=320322 RepID=A0A9E7HVW8_9LILI|nr:Gibberellin regulated protein [Musa troglodytarum]